MTATGQKFIHYTGTSRRLLIPLVYPDGRPFDQPVTSAEWLCGVNNATPEADLYIHKSLGAGVSIEVVKGVPTMIVSLRPADTMLGVNGLKLGSHYHEARIGWGAGDVTPIAVGTMELRKRL